MIASLMALGVAELVVAVVVVAAVVGLAIADVFWPFSVALVIAAVVGWWHGAPLWQWLRVDVVAYYFAAGLGWVFFRWTRIVERALRDGVEKPPRWNNHWDDSIAYWLYWPVDMVAYVLRDLLLDLWRAVRRMVARSFDAYAQWRFRKAGRA